MDMITNALGTLASMAAVVVGLGSVGFIGAWLRNRKVPCNPYGIAGCDCCRETANG